MLVLSRSFRILIVKREFCMRWRELVSLDSVLESGLGHKAQLSRLSTQVGGSPFQAAHVESEADELRCAAIHKGYMNFGYIIGARERERDKHTHIYIYMYIYSIYRPVSIPAVCITPSRDMQS